MEVSIKNTSFKVDPCQFEETWKIIGSGKWENDTIQAIEFFVKQEDTVLDIGAWAGPLTLFMAHKCTKVYSLEPDPVVYKQLTENVDLNPNISDRVECRDIAITKDNGLVNLYAREAFGNSSSSVVHRARDAKRMANVKAATLQNFIKQEGIDHLGFIKIDIESAEYEVLPTIPPSIWEKVGSPTICISFHPPQLKEHLLFKKLGSKFIAKVFLKILKHLPILDRTDKEILRRTSTCFESFKNYKFVYTHSGKPIDKERLDSSEIIAQKHLIFTNRRWE